MEENIKTVETEDRDISLDRAVTGASALAPGGELKVAGLVGSARAYLLARVFRAAARPMLVVLPTDEAAEEFASDLLFFLKAQQVRPFPSTEVLPFELAPPHPEIAASRVELLFRLTGPSDAAPFICVTSAPNLMQRVPPRRTLETSTVTLERGGEYPREGLLGRLREMGYATMTMVEERGEVSTRGGILDIFPPMEANPLRVEFFGDEVERMRTFDISDQRSLADVERTVILPAGETLFTREARLLARSRLMERADELELGRDEWEGLSDRLREGVWTQEMYGLLPLFYEEAGSLFDYLPAGALLSVVDPAAVDDELRGFERSVDASAARLLEKKRFFVEPSAMYLSSEEVASGLGGWPVVSLDSLGAGPGAVRIACSSNLDLAGEMRVNRKKDEPFAPLAARIRGWLDEGTSVVVTATNRGAAERTVELLDGYGLRADVKSGRGLLDGRGASSGGLTVATGALARGFRLPTELLAVVAEEEVFGARVKRRPPPSRKLESFLTQLQDLKEGDYIVHSQHGIGLYRGLKRLEVDGVANDFLLLEYHGGDKLYLPVSRMDLVAKYRGVEGASAGLDRLGGTGWARTKKRVRKSVERLAGELLKLYAERLAAEGHAFSPPGHLFDEFEASFEYEETPDQARAIEETMADMDGARPMDRLICGDVGYGKTEVAMRAAFRAVLDGKQVAVLVPTTVLAQQHYATFTDRFAPYPVVVEVLSRFRSRKEQADVVQRLASGGVDMVIGTHRLLSRDVGFKDLGLAVIDEEHRFGVANKERLKHLKKKVAVLTLTATPIPRTLNMAMASIREMSIISTPPEDRLAIKTRVIRFNDEAIAEAIARELKRGGQVFFVHNRINSIGAMAEFLGRVAPGARVAVAHGRMKESELERKMVGFVSGDYDILLSTSIIESGLDIPTANTIIINRADRFGLADLYQLRGRVGRSSHRAYAYFITPEPARLTDEARRRIEVLTELGEPGSGFKIASHDLEIRGAGELLGTSQSGRIAEVGFDMYVRLLEEAVRELRGEEVTEEFTPEINLRVSQYIPEEYVPDTRQRLGFYKRIASAATAGEMAAIADELADRYGEPPGLVENLLETAGLKLTLKKMRVRELAQKGTRLYLAFADNPDREAAARIVSNAVSLMEAEPGRYRVTPDSRFVVFMGPEPERGPIEETRYILKELSAGCYI
ncbi:MAG: transcription-repair coupling factor [Thermodesulfobacteriota bacterium]